MTTTKLNGPGALQAIAALEKQGGYDNLVQLGRSALDALAQGGGDDARSRELLAAIATIAQNVAGPAPAAPAGRPNLDDPQSIVAHIAKGGRDVVVSDAQAVALTKWCTEAIAKGEHLSSIAAAAKNMEHGLPSMEPIAGLEHVAGNFGPGLQRSIVDAFSDAGHDLKKYGLDDISFGPMLL